MAFLIDNAYGPYGRYNEVVTVNNTTQGFQSGSNLGAAALIKECGATGTITLAKGGTINLAHLTEGVVIEVGIAAVTVSNAKNVYVLKR